MAVKLSALQPLLKNRVDSRSKSGLRSISIFDKAFGYGLSSVLYVQGKTQVLVSISVQNQVPHFLKKAPHGWLTAEYAMLPAATHQRVQRESTAGQKNSRSVEISRLIGRSLRSVVDLSVFPQKTIQIDCDVLQADGGTRSASITAASFALRKVEAFLLAENKIEKPFIKEDIAAVSLGVFQNKIYTDLTYAEDSKVDADFNFVISRSGKIIEVQGTAEQAPLDRKVFIDLQEQAFFAVENLFQDLDNAMKERVKHQQQDSKKSSDSVKKGFSLGYRLAQSSSH